MSTTKSTVLRLERPIVRELITRLKAIDLRHVPPDEHSSDLLGALSQCCDGIQWIEAFCGVHTYYPPTGTQWEGPFTWPCHLVPRIQAAFFDPETFSPECLEEFGRCMGFLLALQDGRKVPASIKPGQYLAIAAASRRLGHGKKRTNWHDRLPKPSNFELDFGKAICAEAFYAHSIVNELLRGLGIAAFCSHCGSLFMLNPTGGDRRVYCDKECSQAAKRRRQGDPKRPWFEQARNAPAVIRAFVDRRFAAYGRTRVHLAGKPEPERYPLGALRCPAFGINYDGHGGLGPRRDTPK